MSDEEDQTNLQVNWADKILAKGLQNLEMALQQTPHEISTGKFTK